MNNKYLIFPKINPVAFHFFYIPIYWYSLMYIFSFIFVMYFALKKRKKLKNWKKQEIEDLLYQIFFGVLLGGRIGYVLFYNIKKFLDNPLYLFEVWKGGMSFHGGFLGVIFVILIFSYKKKKNFFQITDFIVPFVPFCLGLGRIGNFINSELWGRVSLKLPWSMIFPNSYEEDINMVIKYPYLKNIFYQYGALPRHPSQIYEIILEGILLFIIINVFTIKKRPNGSISALFLILYGIFRFISEFFRQPDIQIGFIYNIITMGQLLSVPMIFFGIVLIIYSYKKNNSH